MVGWNPWLQLSLGRHFNAYSTWAFSEWIFLLRFARQPSCAFVLHWSLDERGPVDGGNECNIGTGCARRTSVFLSSPSESGARDDSSDIDVCSWTSCARIGKISSFFEWVEERANGELVGVHSTTLLGAVSPDNSTLFDTACVSSGSCSRHPPAGDCVGLNADTGRFVPHSYPSLSRPPLQWRQCFNTRWKSLSA